MIAKMMFVLLLAAPTMVRADTSYTVRRGDTILKIADRALGIVNDTKDPRRYEFARKIQAKNPQLKNPNGLEPGMILVIPDAPAAAARPVPEVVKPTTVGAAEAEVKLPPAPVAAVEPEPETEPVPAPAPAPAHPSVPEASGLSHDKPQGHGDFISVQPRIQSAKIHVKDLATEAETTVQTKSSFGLDLQYGKVVGEHAVILVNAGVTSTQFKDLEEGLSMNHMSETLKNFGVGFAYGLTSSLHLDMMFSFIDRTYVLPHDATSYELESILIPGADINLSWNFWQAPSFVLGVSAIGEYIGAARKDDIDYKSTFEPVGALYWMSQRGSDKLNYRLTATYRKGHQKTSLTEQHEEAGVLGFAVIFPL